MFQRILVPLDGSQRAEQSIPIAARVARHTGGSIVLLRVVSSPLDDALYSMELAVGAMKQASEGDIAEATAYLATVAQSKYLAGIGTKTEVRSGEPAWTIFPVARSYHADLIVMCSHGETGLKRWRVGSVTQKVARHSSIPVLIVREGAGIPSGLHSEGTRPVRVLVPLDGSPFAEHAIAPAAQLSRALSAPLQGELHLLRVLPLPIIEDDHPREIIVAAKAQAVAEVKTYLHTKAQQVRADSAINGTTLPLEVTSSASIDTDIAGTLIRIAEHGEEQEEIAEGATIARCDVIAMATHGRGGLGRWLVGSVTERVLEDTRLSLLIVRPQNKQNNDKKEKGTTGSKKSETELQSWVGLL